MWDTKCCREAMLTYPLVFVRFSCFSMCNALFRLAGGVIPNL